MASAGLRIEDVAARIGVDPKTVDRWRRGERLPYPRHRAAFADLLRVTEESIWPVDELKPKQSASPVNLAVPGVYASDRDAAVSLLGQLTAVDLANEHDRSPDFWTPDLAPQVITGYLLDDPVTAVVEDEGPLRGPTAGARIRDFTATLMDLDFRYGGGATRRSLLHYFQDEVVPLLHTQQPDALRRDVFGAAAEVAQLLGWSAYDAGRHSAATQYFVQGLRLAHEANDRAMGGRLLSNLSHQANFLGKPDDAIRFARAAQQAAGGQASKTVQAMLLTMEARGMATRGDAAGCARALHQAETLFEQADKSADPQWISYFNEEELAGEAAHCFRDLGKFLQAQEFARRAMHPTRTPPRTKAFIEVILASAALNAGELDEAIALATTAWGTASSLQSYRSQSYLSDFRQTITTAHPHHRQVIEFLQLADSRQSA
jgi:transcriptional regulator with XRE-family HTH domain